MVPSGDRMNQEKTAKAIHDWTSLSKRLRRDLGEEGFAKVLQAYFSAEPIANSDIGDDDDTAAQETTPSRSASLRTLLKNQLKSMAVAFAIPVASYVFLRRVGGIHIESRQCDCGGTNLFFFSQKTGDPICDIHFGGTSEHEAPDLKDEEEDDEEEGEN